MLVKIMAVKIRATKSAAAGKGFPINKEALQAPSK
jgi:hypothetical protein